MKMVLLPDHIPVNNYELIVPGAPPLIGIVSIDGLEKELETVDLPDRTTASGGNTKAIEFVMMHAKHHTAEDLFLHAWFEESKLAIPTYKKDGTLLVSSISGLNVRSFNLLRLYPSKEKTADLAMENEGEMHMTEWTMKCDDMIPV